VAVDESPEVNNPVRIKMKKFLSMSFVTWLTAGITFFGGILMLSWVSGAIALEYRAAKVVDIINLVLWCCSAMILHASSVMMYISLKLSWEDDLGTTLNELVKQEKAKDDVARNSGEN
jgi:hypothetical protein